MGLEHDKRLEDLWLFAFRSRAEDRAVGGDFTPPENAEAEIDSEGLKRLAVGCRLAGIVGVEEDIADCVLACLWQLALKVSLSFAHEERMRDACHDTRTVTIASIGTCGASMRHGTE